MGIRLWASGYGHQIMGIRLWASGYGREKRCCCSAAHLARPAPKRSDFNYAVGMRAPTC